MKKSIVFSIVAVMAIVAGGYIAYMIGYTTNIIKSVKAETIQYEDNVGNGEEYAYKITEVVGDEIHGLPLNKEGFGNRGIFLYKHEVSFDVKAGDEIIVVWGEYEDEFERIERAVQAEDGSYVSEKFYQ